MSTTFAFFSDTFLAFSSLNLLQPPPQGDGERGNYPPPRGYEGQPPHPHYGYGPPPPGYPPYPMAPYMYPPYGQHPMYGGPHHPPPHYPYGPEHGRGPYGPPDQDYSTRDPSRGESRRGEDKANGGGSTYDDSASSHQGEDESEAGGENSAVSARLKTYIKPRIPSTQEVLDRRSRKNAQSRARAGKLRGRIGIIEKKPPEEWTEEEAKALDGQSVCFFGRQYGQLVEPEPDGEDWFLNLITFDGKHAMRVFKNHVDWGEVVLLGNSKQ